MTIDQDYSGGMRRTNADTPPRRPEMTDTHERILQAAREGRGLNAEAVAAEIKSRSSEPPAPKPKARPEDPIESRVETHRASISSHEKSITALETQRDLSIRKLRGELAELTRSFEETRELYQRAMESTASEIAASLDYHRRLVQSDRAAMDSLLGRNRIMIDAAGAAEGASQAIARQIDEGVKAGIAEFVKRQPWSTPVVVDPGKAGAAMRRHASGKAKFAVAPKNAPADREAASKAARAINSGKPRDFEDEVVKASRSAKRRGQA